MGKFKKVIATVLSAVMAFSVMGVTAFADDKYAKDAEIKIATAEELVEAVKNQKNGQTWILSEGEYDVDDDLLEVEANINGVKNGFVFPIFVDDITIKAAKGDDVLITSSYDPGKESGGIWSNQNLITISGKNVEIQGVDLKGNYNSYYEGCNKVIELIAGGKNLVIEDVELLPLEDSEGKVSSGSIYFNVDDAGDSILKDVTMYSWVNAKAVNDGTVTVDNLVQDFRNNVYAGYSDDNYGYAWNPGVSGENVEVEKLVIKADNNTKIDEQIFNDNLRNGTVIELEEGTYEIDKTLLIDKDVTINGNGSTIKVTTDIFGEPNGSNSAIEIENGANVVINNVSIDGNENVKHGINIFTAQGEDKIKVELNGVSIEDCKGYGVVNNASDLTVTDISTSGNGWGGINVDNSKSAGTDGASITINGGKIDEDNSVYFENANAEAGTTVDAVIKDGTFEGNVTVAGNNADVTIEDGKFNGKVEVTEDSNSDLTIENGKFTNDVSEYLDEDSHLVKDEDGNYIAMDEETYEDYLDDNKSHGSSFELEEKENDRKDDDDKDKEEDKKPETPEEESIFSDVAIDDPNYDAIVKVFEKGWMVGVSDGVFAPNGTLTRGMAATILWNKAGKPEPVNAAPFLDVTADAWYAKAVAWAYEQGIVLGYDAETFGPNDFVTTEQFTIMLDKSEGKTPAPYAGGAPNATRAWVASKIA